MYNNLYYIIIIILLVILVSLLFVPPEALMKAKKKKRRDTCELNRCRLFRRFLIHFKYIPPCNPRYYLLLLLLLLYGIIILLHGRTWTLKQVTKLFIFKLLSLS